MNRRRALMFCAVLIGVLVAPGAGGGGTVGNIYFTPAAGWTQVTSGIDPDTPDVASVIAANVPIQDRPGVAHADETVRDLPATGLVITASISLPTHEMSFLDGSLPLRLADADVRHAFEGQPNPDVPEYVLWQRVNGLFLDVRVFFGSQAPSAAAVAEAQAELERLVVP